MKHIYVNLKRFDIPPSRGGVNRLAPIEKWAEAIVRDCGTGLRRYNGQQVEFAMFFPEAHLLAAVAAGAADSPIAIGAQGVCRGDTAVGGNFGAFTASLTANAAASIGCSSVIIGHCEERRALIEVMSEAGLTDRATVSRLLGRSVERAMAAGLKVLYCIGETAVEQDNWQAVLREQIELGLGDVERSNIVLAYEPVWAIGPGKVPPDRDYIRKIAQYVQEVSGGLDVVYGGGLKKENAAMLASIDEISGGLIALTRFSGEIGFYPDEYLEIVETYLSTKQELQHG